MVSIRTALALLVSLNALSPVAAAGVDGSLPEARMTWRLSFGNAAQAVQTGYGLTVGYRGLDGVPAGELLELDVSDQAAWARLAGLPLFQRDYGAQQNDGEMAAGADSSPWYGRKWALVPCDADNKPAGCVEFSGRVAAGGYAIDPETLRWLDAGTGHMGNLIAR